MERERLQRELEPIQLLRNTEIQKVIERPEMKAKIMSAQTREEKSNVIIDVLDELSDVTKNAVLNTVGAHKERCDKTNSIKTSANKITGTNELSCYKAQDRTSYKM
jgi:3-deoxy-D-manno-octulosonic-acid transferase